MSEAQYGTRTLEVLERRELGAYTLLALADEGGRPAAGQFAMLAAADGWGGGADERPYLPRAISVCTHERGRTEYLLEAVGPGTRLLCELERGAEVRVLGPLGNGFGSPATGEKPILVGGGIGVAPLVLLEHELPRATVLLGFRDAARAACAALFAEPRVATDDGSIGSPGSVVDLLDAELDGTPARVYACGPAAMLEAVRALCAARSVPCQLALESPMACGYGACWGCVVPLVDGTYVRLCVDGPVIAGDRLAAVGEGFGASS